MKVAVLMLAAGRLEGGGGAERFFSNAVRDIQRLGRSDLEFTLVTDAAIQRKADGTEGRFIPLPHARGPLRHLQVARCLLAMQHREGFNMLLIPLPTTRYLPALWGMQARLGRACPRIAIGVVDCALAHSWVAGKWVRCGQEQDRINRVYRLFFSTLPLDGIITWYERARQTLLGAATPSQPHIQVLQSYYVDTVRFQPAPAKERVIVFAGRLSQQKRPLLLLEALELLRKDRPQLLDGWRVELYGHGALDSEVARCCQSPALKGLVQRLKTADLAPVLARSRLFVSTQAFENFSSLAVLEAMACANSIIAFDVGETQRVVCHEDNGLLAPQQTAASLSDTLARYLNSEAQWPIWEHRSRQRCCQEFTPQAFVDEIQDFVVRVGAQAKRTWRDRIGRSAAQPCPPA